MKKYILYPGYVRSKYDGELHLVTYGKLIELYKLNPKDCIDGSKVFLFHEFNKNKLIHLSPREDGNYG